MDAEADKIIESWADPSKSIEIDRLNEVYGSLALPLDKLAEYGWPIALWAVKYGAGKGADYLLPKLKTAIKQVYHDRAAGKEAPTPDELRQRLIRLSASISAKASVTATMHVKHADGDL